MANSNGIFKRGNSHYLRVVIPKEHPLGYFYKSGKVIVSLGACSYREALTSAVMMRAQILGTIDGVPVQIKQKSGVSQSDNKNITYLRDVFLRWKESKPRSNDAINTCMRALALYEEHTGNRPIHIVTRAQGDSFRAWLQQPERKTSSKTAYDRFTWIKTLFKYAYRDLEVISRNPWEGIELFKETTNQRRPWTAIELQTLFGQPLFKEYALPKDWRAGSDAAYWIPLIGLYTGARLSEIAQLSTNDIKTIDAIHALSISSLGINQKVKTVAGIRMIPLHSELIRLGFLEYVKKIKGGGSDSLWPELKQRKDKAGGYFSNWFGEYRRSIGLRGYPDFHCFRHTLRSQLCEAEVPEHVIDALLGHEIKGSTGAKVYTHRTLATLLKAIEIIDYRTLKLLRNCN